MKFGVHENATVIALERDKSRGKAGIGAEVDETGVGHHDLANQLVSMFFARQLKIFLDFLVIFLVQTYEHFSFF